MDLHCNVNFTLQWVRLGLGVCEDEIYLEDKIYKIYKIYLEDKIYKIYKIYLEDKANVGDARWCGLCKR